MLVVSRLQLLQVCFRHFVGCLPVVSVHDVNVATDFHARVGHGFPCSRAGSRRVIPKHILRFQRIRGGRVGGIFNINAALTFVYLYDEYSLRHHAGRCFFAMSGTSWFLIYFSSIFCPFKSLRYIYARLVYFLFAAWCLCLPPATLRSQTTVPRSDAPSVQHGIAAAAILRWTAWKLAQSGRLEICLLCEG